MTRNPTSGHAKDLLRAGVLACGVMTVASFAQAQDLTFPAGASLQTREDTALASYDIPVAVWVDGTLPVTTVEGHVVREAWKIATPGLTSLELLRPLREQLLNDQWQLVFECQTEACGGFDFRFATTTLPPPEMQINLGDFRFLTAQRDSAAGPDYVTLFVSPVAQAGFVQVTRVMPMETTQTPAPISGAAALNPGDTLADQLDKIGRAVLPDLAFATGAAVLQDQPFVSLAELAAYLQAHPDRTAALVGHTDATGGLAANIALSRQRAGAVLERLVRDHGVSRGQVTAEGIGYLAPVASNMNAAGRDANRRVEVIVTSSE